MSWRNLQKLMKANGGLTSTGTGGSKISNSNSYIYRRQSVSTCVESGKSSKVEKGDVTLGGLQQAGAPDVVALAEELASSLETVLCTIMTDASLEDRFDNAFDWVQEMGAVELSEVASVADDLCEHLALKRMEKNRFIKHLEAALKPAEEAEKKAKEEEAVEMLLQKAYQSGDVGELKVALSKASKMKLNSTLVQQCQKAHQEKDEAEIKERAGRFCEQAEDAKSRMPKNTQYTLVSAPEHSIDGHSILAVARQEIHALGHANKAGDAKDWFHANMMNKEEMDTAVQGWRIAWKSKICSYLVDLQRYYPNDAIVFLTIDGGPECMWELQQLQNEIKKAYPYYKLRRFRDLDMYEEYLLSGAP